MPVMYFFGLGTVVPPVRIPARLNICLLCSLGAWVLSTMTNLLLE